MRCPLLLVSISLKSCCLVFLWKKSLMALRNFAWYNRITTRKVLVCEPKVAQTVSLRTKSNINCRFPIHKLTVYAICHANSSRASRLICEGSKASKKSNKAKHHHLPPWVSESSTPSSPLKPIRTGFIVTHQVLFQNGHPNLNWAPLASHCRFLGLFSPRVGL